MTNEQKTASIGELTRPIIGIAIRNLKDRSAG